MLLRWHRETKKPALLILLMQAVFLLIVHSYASAQAVLPASNQAIPNTYFGMTLQNINDYPWVYVGSMGKANGVQWPYLEPEKGVFNWARLDSWVAKTQAEGISLFYSNDYVPKWAAANPASCFVSSMDTTVCTSSVANIQDWDDFVNALVTRYSGKIQIYELWNEPDQPEYFTGTMAQMVTLTNHMYNIVRSLNPKATIVSPSANSDLWLEAYWQAGGVKTTDVVSIHGYPADTNPVPEVVCAFRTLPLKALMTQYGVKAPIWDTEGSWGGYNTLSSADLQAAFVSRYLTLHWACGVQRLYWYQWDGANLAPYWGMLWGGRGATTAAGYAYWITQQWLGGATMPNSCLVNGAKMPAPPALYKGVYSCALTRTGGYQGEIVWNTVGSSIYTAPDKFTKYEDLTGASHTLPANHEVAIGLKPILLEN